MIGNGAGKRSIDSKFTAPRRVRNGLKLKRRDAAAARPAEDAVPSVTTVATGPTPGRRLLAMIESRADAEQIVQGLEYARLGQIVSLELQAGQINARVQGRAPRPYHTIILVPHLAEAQWESVIQAMAGEAMYVAKLLAGEMPAGFEELLRGRGLALLPVDAAMVETRCQCTLPQPCRHAIAVAHIVAEQLDHAPLSMFALAGMDVERVLERLRHARTVQSHGVASTHGDPLIPESQLPPPPLQQCIADFWRTGAELSNIESRAPSHHAPHALLRRLGPSPIDGRFPMVGLLASIYDQVSQHATALREGQESRP